MKPTNSYFLNIDFVRLRSQKLTLLYLIDNINCNLSKESVDDLTGILLLIDSIQDMAVDQNGFTEHEVFGTLSQPEPSIIVQLADTNDL